MCKFLAGHLRVEEKVMTAVCMDGSEGQPGENAQFIAEHKSLGLRGEVVAGDRYGSLW